MEGRVWLAHFASLKNVGPDPASGAGGLGDTEIGAVLFGERPDFIVVVTSGL
jgi:hypothetical protein